MKSKSAILHSLNKPLKIENVTLPEKLDYGQVLVKLEYSGICGAQINEIQGTKGKDKFLPHLLGHEGSGKVIKIGPGVKKVKKNDHVVLHWRQGSGIQSNTPKYKLKNKIINAGWVTTFNEYAVISENRLTKIPKNFNLKLAPLLGCSVTTAFGVIKNDISLSAGDSVIIFGLGGVGLNLVQASQMTSAYPIVGVDVQKNKINLAKKYGLDQGFIFNNLLEKKINKYISNEKFDYAIDTTGNTKVIELCYKITKSNGTVVCVGVPSSKNNISIHSLPLHFKKRITGSHGGDTNPDLDIPKIIKLIQAKKLNLSKLITHVFNINEINKAIKLVKSGKSGRVLIKF